MLEHAPFEQIFDFGDFLLLIATGEFVEDVVLHFFLGFDYPLIIKDFALQPLMATLQFEDETHHKY